MASYETRGVIPHPRPGAGSSLREAADDREHHRGPKAKAPPPVDLGVSMEDEHDPEMAGHPDVADEEADRSTRMPAAPSNVVDISNMICPGLERESGRRRSPAWSRTKSTSLPRPRPRRSAARFQP